MAKASSTSRAASAAASAAAAAAAVNDAAVETKWGKKWEMAAELDTDYLGDFFLRYIYTPITGTRSSEIVDIEEST